VLLADRPRFCVSAGGDLRIGGPDAAKKPYPVTVEDPFGGEPLTTIKVGSGALATSGIGSRIWQREDGSYAHHLIDPATGDSAWTGLIQVTALAPTALEAETLSKRVLLGGPQSIGLLERFGGVAVHDDCKVELVGSLAQSSPRMGFSMTGARQ
jgi:thiamine biosynthesis lipoprotein